MAHSSVCSEPDWFNIRRYHPCRRAEHHSFFEMPDHEMAFLSFAQRNSYRYNVQGCIDGCCGCQQGQYVTFRAESCPIPTYRLSSRGGTSQQSSPASNKRKAGITMPETVFDSRCKRHHTESNRFLNFSADANPMLPSTQPSLLHDDQQRKGNDDSIYIPLNIAGDNFPSMPSSQTYPVSNEALHNEVQGFLGINEVGSWNQGTWVPVKDALSLNYTATWPVPLNSGDSRTDHIQPFDQGCEVPQWANECLTPLTTSIEDHFLNATAYVNIPLNELYSPLQIAGPWDESLHQDMEGTLLPSFPNNEPFDNIFQDSISLIPTGIESVSVEPNFIASSAPVESTRPLERRKLLPKPPMPLSDIPGIEIGEGSEEGSSKSGRRRRFTEEEKKAIANMRRLGNCARCIVRKTKCTEGDICQPCQKLYPQYTLQKGPNCPRGRLGQYNNAFFPRLIFAHLDQPDMTVFSSRVQFSNIEKRVRVSLGSSYPSVPLMVSAFHTADEKFSHIPDLTSTSNDDMPSFATIPSSPFGVRPSGAHQLSQTCTDYLELINKDEKWRIGSSRITRRVIDAAKRFQQTSSFENQDILLPKAIKIAEIYLLMGKRFLFSTDSLLDGAECSTTLPLEASRFLDRQIKSTFYHMLKCLIPEVLLILDGRLRKQEKETWATSLLTHLLLSSSVEQIQVTVDSFVLFKMSSEAEDHFYTRRSGRDACRSLEQAILEHTWLLVERILKGITKKYDFFDVRVQTDENFRLSKAETNLVGDIRQIVFDHEEEIEKRAKDDYYGGLSQLTSEFKQFKVRNSARVVSKVLQRLPIDAGGSFEKILGLA